MDMKAFKCLVGAAVAAALVAGCGGGGGGGVASENKQGFTSLVSFGDSLSDAGTHAVGSVAVLGGGRYTINSGNPAAPTKIWLDLIATQYGLPAPCPAVTGLNANGSFALVPTGGPAAVTAKAGCTNHAQGGSRVTNPIGPANAALPASAGGEVGQLTYPITQQISQYLSRNGGSFGGKTLVTVLAGGNDIFMNGGAVSAAAGGGAGAVGAGVIAGWTNGADALAGTLAAGGATATNAAVAQALATMSQAGAALANQVKTEIVGKGAKYVLVINLPDVSSSPYGIENPTAAPLVNQMVQAFNASLSAGLAGVSGVVVGDAYTTSRDQYNNPSQYGASNSTSRACKRAPANPLDGASLVCNSTNVIAGDVSKYLFADDVHPTPYGHQLLAQFASSVLAKAGWL
jgi:outer membrane lipase/esterase